MCWVFKINLQKLYAAAYIVLFLPDSSSLITVSQMSTNILPYLYLRFLLFLLLIALFSLLCYPRDKFQKFKCSIRFHYSVPCRMFSLNFNILKQENKIKERIVMIFFNITFLPYPYTTRIGSQYGLLVFFRTFFGTELLFLSQS